MYIYIYPYTNVKKHFVEKKQHTQLWKKNINLSKHSLILFQSEASSVILPITFQSSPLASPKTRGKKDKTKIILVYLSYYTLKSDVTKKKRTRTITPKPCQKTTLFFGGVCCGKLVSAPFPAQLEWLLHEVMEMAPPVTRQCKGSTLQATITSLRGKFGKSIDSKVLWWGDLSVSRRVRFTVA